MFDLIRKKGIDYFAKKQLKEAFDYLIRLESLDEEDMANVAISVDYARSLEYSEGFNLNKPSELIKLNPGFTIKFGNQIREFQKNSNLEMYGLIFHLFCLAI